uniref:Uncharacterized protein n=1 Tax=Arundo donax TaxID=35708 RepID=A0A0A9CQ70_ARUDO
MWSLQVGFCLMCQATH